MSVAIHMNGRKRSDMKAPLATHQVRLDEEDGKRALRDTDSAINPKLSHMNVALVPDQSKTRFKEMKSKLDKMSEKRVENGGKRIYKSANVFMVGTLQIGDDSLELLGWKFEDGKKLPSDKQSDRVIKDVRTVYEQMLMSVQAQPEIYGEVFSATLHMDEGSPHVDFMSDVLDVNEPDKLVSHYVQGVKGVKAKNGKPAVKGTPKGQKLRTMQDQLMAHTNLSKETVEKFELKRGDGTKSKIDKVKTIRQDERNLDTLRTSLNARSEVLGDLEGKVSLREELIGKREEKASDKESGLDMRESRLDIKEKRLTMKENVLSGKEVMLKSWEKVQDRFNDVLLRFTEEKQEKKRRNLTDIVKRFLPVTNDNMKEFSDKVDEVAGDGKITLTDEDLPNLEDKKNLRL